MDSIWELIFLYMAEGALVGFVGMAFIGFRLNLRQFLMVGLSQGIVVYLVRGTYNLLEWPLLTHSLFNLMGLIVILRLVTKRNWNACSAGGLLGFITVLLSETVTLPLLCTFFKTSVERILADTWSHIFLGYLADWLLILAALVLAVTGKSLISINESE